MELKTHPFHKRAVRIISIALVLLGIIFWCASYYAQEVTQNQFWLNLWVTLFMVTGGVFIIFGGLSAKLSICPSCKRPLRNNGRRSEQDTRLFECSHCHILWDSQVALKLGSD